jgi:hypothetical protein
MIEDEAQVAGLTGDYPVGHGAEKRTCLFHKFRAGGIIGPRLEK